MNRTLMSLILLATPGAVAASPADQAYFHQRVEPLLAAKCLGCHGGEQRGGLDLRQAATVLSTLKDDGVIVPGDPAASLLYRQIRTGAMPPEEPLEAAEIELLEQWIRDGAYFPEAPLDPFTISTDARAGYDWWSFQPLQSAELPEIGAEGWQARWSRHPIDRFVGAALLERELEPGPPALPRDLIRRLHYGLTGLPPGPAETEAFLRACEQETGSRERVGERAYRALVDQLLASPAYGEHWGRHWLDVVRFGESTGYEVNHIIDNIWPYRDYVIDSFNEDKPYDQFLREQIAGDALRPGDPQTEVATALLVAGPHDIVGNQDAVQAAQIRADTVDEIVRTTSEAFLALTMGCARCHDHKFDPISQREYYRLYSVFSGVHHGSRTIAAPAEREAREKALAPLHEKRNALHEEKNALESAILARAEAKADEYAAQWVRPSPDRTGTEETFGEVEARFVRLVSEGRDTDPNQRAGYRIDEFEVWSAESPSRNLALASNGGRAEGRSRSAEDFAGAYQADVTINGAFGEKWIAEGPELTIILAQPEAISRVYFSSDRPGELGDYHEAAFVCEYRIEVSMDGETWTVVADSKDRAPANDAHRRKRLLELEAREEERDALAALAGELAAVNGEIAAVPDLPHLWAGTFRQPEAPTVVFLGGDPQRTGDEVAPGAPAALARAGAEFALAADAPEQERRLALADWLADPENPLPARVLANRLWHYHFGTGIVNTPSDFGFMGGAPSHPELLDWLAGELLHPSVSVDYEPVTDQAWRLKRMHKLIVLSETYRQSAAYRPEPARVDADARYLWRFPPQRLTGEALRDTMLSVAGQLDRSMGGEGFRLYRYLRDNVSTYVPLDEHGPETYRRAVYHQNVRASYIDLVTDFDGPDCALPAPRRSVTTSPLQALTLMNHSFALDMAEAMAARLEAEADDAGERIDLAFRLAFTRDATRQERESASALIAEHGLRAFCRALLNTNELLYLN